MRTKIILLLITGLVLVSDAFGFQNKDGVVRGKVTDDSGKPLAGAGITVENGFQGAHSNSDGSYILDGLKRGIYRIRFTFLGYETKIVEVNVTGESVADVSLVQKTLEAGEVIVNATRAGEHSPLAYITIGNEALKNLNTGQDIPYILGLTPSLVETSEAGTGIGYTSLRIRGTDASRINVTIDGIPLNDPESEQVFWVDLPDLASSVDNIQVQRGAGTSSNGAGAFGATVSIQTKSPENEPFAQISTSYGSFNTMKNTITASTGLLANKFALMMRLSRLQSDGYIRRTWSDHKSAYLSGVYRSGKSRLQMNVILGEEHTGIGWWGVPKEMLSIDRRYNPAGEFTDENGQIKYYDNESDNYFQNHYQLLYSLRINYALDFNAALHYTSGKGYYEEYKDDDALSAYGLPDITIGDSLISSTDLIRRKWMKNSFTGLVWSLKYKKDRLEAVVGGGANYYYGDHFGRIIWMRNAGNLEKDYQWYLGHGAKSDISLYGKADYSVTDKISLFGDIQFRYINYKINGIDDDLKMLDLNHQYGFFNPKAGLFFSITPHQDAFLSFSVANREPTRSDFTEAAGDPGATPKPETLYDNEIGYKLTGNKYSLVINLYGMIYKDQLVPTGELSNTGYSIMTNVAKSYRLGAEISAGLRPTGFLDWNFSLTISRNKIIDFTEHYTDYNTSDWSETYKSKNLGTVDIAYSPVLIGSSDMNFKVIRNFELHFTSKYIGSQYFDNTMSSDRKIDPYFVNNLMASFSPSVVWLKNAEFQLQVNNIFNIKYENNAYGGNWYEDGIEKTWSYFFPQAGINFMLKASLTF
jgi:Outer membrane receptor proteins, mostly Fe transport